jgi:hypothetical protein
MSGSPVSSNTLPDIDDVVTCATLVCMKHNVHANTVKVNSLVNLTCF